MCEILTYYGYYDNKIWYMRSLQDLHGCQKLFYFDHCWSLSHCLIVSLFIEQILLVMVWCVSRMLLSIWSAYNIFISEWNIGNKNYDKRNDFSFLFVNFSFLCNNISIGPSYGINLTADTIFQGLWMLFLWVLFFMDVR